MKVNFEALFNRKTFFIDAFLLLLNEVGKRNLVRDSSHVQKQTNSDKKSTPNAHSLSNAVKYEVIYK